MVLVEWNIYSLVARRVCMQQCLNCLISLMAVLPGLSMDGCVCRCVGYMHYFPSILAQYSVLDRRYGERDPTVMTISFLEIVLYTPLCLCCAYALSQNKWYYAPLSIATSSVCF